MGVGDGLGLVVELVVGMMEAVGVGVRIGDGLGLVVQLVVGMMEAVGVVVVWVV